MWPSIFIEITFTDSLTTVKSYCFMLHVCGILQSPQYRGGGGGGGGGGAVRLDSAVYLGHVMLSYLLCMKTYNDCVIVHTCVFT